MSGIAQSLFIHGTATAPGAPATYVGGATYAAGGAAQSFFLPGGGVAAGDMLIVYAPYYDMVMVPSTGWTSISYTEPSYGYISKVWWKILTAPELGSSFNSNGGFALLVAVYRGATVLTLRVSEEDTGTTLPFPGFAPSGSTKGVLALFADRDITSTSVGMASGFTQRLSTVDTYFVDYLADELSGYTNTTKTFTNFDNTFDQFGMLLELT